MFYFRLLIKKLTEEFYKLKFGERTTSVHSDLSDKYLSEYDEKKRDKLPTRGSTNTHSIKDADMPNQTNHSWLPKYDLLSFFVS